MLTNSQSTPQSSHFTGNMNVTKMPPTSFFSSFHYDQQPQILSPPIQNIAISQFAPSITNQSLNGVLKDRNNQQQQQQALQYDKRNRSLKDQLSNKLTTLNETHSLPNNDGQLKTDISEQITPTQKRKETKRKSNLFTVR